jgi:hypothetical protein
LTEKSARRGRMAPKLGESPQSEAQETFAGAPGKDRGAPISLKKSSGRAAFWMVTG